MDSGVESVDTQKDVNVETYAFQAEIIQLMSLIINTFYSNKEIFLRELISNSSDALDKIRHQSLTDQTVLDSNNELYIRLIPDKTENSLTIVDSGIGMTKNDMITNLGTIAQSGTKGFMEAMQAGSDVNMIGQFGVGFYSSFIVADKVVVETRRAGAKANEAVRWSCEGEADYQLENIERAERGTAITLHLKTEEHEFGNDWRLRSIVKKYSDHIAIPVEMLKQEPPSMPAEEGKEDEEQAEVVPQWEAVNDAKALWTRSRSEVSDEEYQEFYRHVSSDFSEPLDWSHNRVEGKHEYTSLLYIPSMAPMDLYQREASR